ncbi:MAG TPA: hypothetical protein VKG87_09855, partial [Terriglobales bacterium]|nr:hypothetical protein [Terriglobales bacterium]
MISAIVMALRHLLGWLVVALSSREDLILENLALGQQLLALHTHRPRRRVTILHKLFWVVLQRLWSGWRGVVHQNLSLHKKVLWCSALISHFRKGSFGTAG